MKAVILAGGLGMRLRPFTQVIPKPLLPVGESSVLEIQIMTLKSCGVDEIFIATNYMSNYVEAFLGNGEKYGVTIVFSKESEPLGTCGPVLLLRDRLNEPFLLVNGDILTTIDFRRVYESALATKADLIVVTRKVIAPFNFGKVVSEGDFIVDVQEKPDLELEILAGIYVLKPPIFSLIPPKQYFGIDLLIKDMLSRGLKVGKYLMKEYWLDIGQINDYQTAQAVYDEHFRRLREDA